MKDWIRKTMIGAIVTIAVTVVGAGIVGVVTLVRTNVELQAKVDGFEARRARCEKIMEKADELVAGTLTLTAGAIE